ncbi:odorant receptor 82a-like [Apis mellifera]|uniref:Odorant receptor n=1 Tax=Apis mellifera TaxID=7460 RepID=A0A7M7GYB2_APIME|nr:odorant receptor 82a-like [Apis mellifera]|eukprot:XP_006565958.1 odorant receptor 82a-like [Apis mellifera]
MADDIAAIQKKFGSLNEYSIQLNRWLSKTIGVWPLSSSSSKFEKIMTKILIFLCCIIALFVIIPSLLHFTLVKEDIISKLKTLGPIGYCFGGGLNYAILLLRKNDIRYCIEHMKADWKAITRTDDQQIMLKNAKIGRIISCCFAAFMQFSTVIFCAVFGVFKRTIKISNESMEIYVLPFPTYKIPVDVNPGHNIVLGFQFLAGYITTGTVIIAFSFATVFACHAVGQLTIMITWIEEFVNRPQEENKNVRVEEISVIIEHHLRILSFLERTEHLLSPICFMEMFKNILTICMLSYCILAEWSGHDIRALSAYASAVMNISLGTFLICYVGEILTEKCKEIGNMVYMTNWYRLPKKDILNLIMIITRCSMEYKMSAGKMIDMSVITFGNIVKTIFAYLNILRQMTIL